MDNPRFPLAVLMLSAIGLGGIAISEGFRDKAYDDGVGVQTIGYGSTRRDDGTPVKKGDVINADRALIRLQKDTAIFERELKTCIGEVPLKQAEWDAFVSLAYNVGTPAVCKGSVVKALKKIPPDYQGACTAILKYNQAGGVVNKGLVKRREKETLRCRGD